MPAKSKNTRVSKPSPSGRVRDGAPKESPPESLASFDIPVQNPRNIYALYTAEFSGLTPDNLKFYLECSRKGLNFWKSLLFEETRRRDMRIASVCQTRKLGVANKEWQLSFDAESDVPESQQNELRDFIKYNLSKINFTNFITDIVEAQIQGVSVFEITFELKDGKLCINELSLVPNHLLCFDDLNNEYRFLDLEKVDVTNLRSRSWNTMDDRIELSGLVLDYVDPVKLMEVHSFDGNAQNGLQNGCIDSLIWSFLFKVSGLKDWAIYIERFATPSVLAKYPPLMNKADKSKLNTAVKNFGHNFKGVIPNTATLEFLTDQGKSQAKEVFDNYIAFWNKEIAIRVLGQSLTTDIGTTGSYAASQTHDAVRRDIMVADMLLVKDTVNKLIRKLIDLNFPSVTEYPEFSFEEEEDIEYKLKRSEVILNLRQAGWAASQENIETEFGLEVSPAVIAGAAPGTPQEPPTGEEYIENFIEEYFNGIQR